MEYFGIFGGLFGHFVLISFRSFIWTIPQESKIVHDVSSFHSFPSHGKRKTLTPQTDQRWVKQETA